MPQLGSSEAGLSRTRFPESICITLHPLGEERRGCTGCIRPCIDISATDTYWHDLSGKRGLQFAWTSYPGLVMGFFLLMLEQLHGRLDHVRSGLWAYRSDSLELLYTPLHHASLLHLQRLVSLPALLVLSGCLSTGSFLVVEAHMARRLRRYLAAADARRLARHRTRLLATFTAVNVFFFFSDPSLGALWGAIGRHPWMARLCALWQSQHPNHQPLLHHGRKRWRLRDQWREPWRQKRPQRSQCRRYERRWPYRSHRFPTLKRSIRRPGCTARFCGLWQSQHGLPLQPPG